MRAAALRPLLYALATAALLAAAAYLAWNTRPTDDRARVEAAARLQLLNELDARWDLAVLAAKRDPGPLAQAEANLVPLIQRGLADLRQLAAALASPTLSANLPGVAAAFEAKSALAVQIGRDTTALGEALARALAATAEMAIALRSEPDPRLRARAATDALAMELANAELLAFWGATGDARRDRVDAALQVLPRLDAVHGPAQIVLDGKSGLEVALGRFALAPAGPRLSALTTAFSAEVQADIERQQLFRTYLLFYSAALLVLLAWVVSRLVASWRVIGRINHALQAANENLEQKVAQRTRDLSDALAHLKASEAQLIQSEKMSSLGQMVAGIAHEINTPVAYVKNSLGSVDSRLDAIARLAAECEKLLAMLDAGDTPDAMLDLQLGHLSDAARALGGAGAVGELGTLVRDGLYGVDQIAQIVGHLRDFSRLDRGQVQRFDIHQGIESTLLLARHLLKGIRVEKRFAADGTLFGASSQINQVLLNLITNAVQAMGPAGGTLTIATAGDGDQMAIDVTDTGPGIPAEVLPKIFDPFFTTKPVGQGTGLGLSISYKIVAQHGGRIEVRSQPGRGTTFRIRLPRAGSAAAAAAARSPSPGAVPAPAPAAAATPPAGAPVRTAGAPPAAKAASGGAPG